ncbi:MAG TPA: hypothetical protein G4O19_03895 [Dehalococcoidia bacterium]|nr:hypothetical protein [Dehalococcoidia bacterium]
MSDKETNGNENQAQEVVEQKTKAEETAASEAIGWEAADKEVSAEGQAVKEAEAKPKTLEPTAIGDERVAILKHDIYREGGENATESISIALSTKNVSDATIGSVLFEAELYDIEGNVLDKVEQKTTDFKEDVIRNVRLNYSKPDSDKVRSYCVKVARIMMAPEPVVTGNDKITILKHSLTIDNTAYHGPVASASIAIRNVSEDTIATLLFEATFYDIEGNILNTVKHSEIELKPNTSRAVNIQCPQQHSSNLKSYNIRIARMTTTDIERVQLRRNEIRTTDTGEEVRGIVKNISNVKTDAALVATFLNYNNENIGTRVVILKDIEPNTTRQFHFLFEPMEGDRVKSYNFCIGEVAE